MGKSGAKTICVEFYPPDYAWLDMLKDECRKEREKTHQNGFGISPYVRGLIITDLKKRKRKAEKEKEKN